MKVFTLQNRFSPLLDINRPDSAGNTLLFLACASNDPSVSLLLKRGANVNIVNNEVGRFFSTVSQKT